MRIKLRNTDFMSMSGGPSFQLAAGVAEFLMLAAAEAAKAGVRRLRPAPIRRSRGGTLRPGAATPLWLALVAEVRPRLRRRGARMLLARELGVHCSRITEYFISRTAMPDAERAIELMLWLARAKQSEAQVPARKNKSP